MPMEINAENFLQGKVNTLQASISTLDDQIKRLKNYTPSFQLKIWRERRARLNKSLKHYKQLLKNEKSKLS